MAKNTSTHIMPNGRKVKIKRNWNALHIGANYHIQEWGEPSSPGHELLGDHEGMIVEHLDEGPTGGPEFLITFADGAKVTVLCADTVQAYLETTNAQEAS